MDTTTTAASSLDPHPATSIIGTRGADGYMDIKRFSEYAASRHAESMELIGDDVARDRDLLGFITSYDNISTERDNFFDDDQLLSHPPPPPKKARRRRCLFARQEEGGPLIKIIPEQSMWYLMYVNNVLLATEEYLRVKFRERFRLPYEKYLDLVHDVKLHPHLFERWLGHKINNVRCSPIELLVLGTLRYLGRGWTFDDIEEATAVGKDTHRNFLHCFTHYGSTVLASRYIVPPKSSAEAATHSVEFSKAGFPGCVGSTDCTHISTEKCEYNLKNNHLGAKSSHTTRSYCLTANHRRRILHTTRGGPGRWNDQTMVTYDTFVSGLHDGSVLKDVSFELLEKDVATGTIFKRKYHGAYVITDNGFHDHSTTIPPIANTVHVPEIRWSKWVESMRKDVECTFGILKGRWRILKTGVRIHGVDCVDDIWITCCALHNWLLDIDGLSSEWTEGTPVTSDWEGELGMNDFEGLGERIPNAIARLRGNMNPRNYDSSSMGWRESPFSVPESNDNIHDVRSAVVSDTNMRNELTVRDITRATFRSKLIQHFDIKWKRNEIIWPRSKRARDRPTDT
jgi:hypothetical protein